MKLHKRLAPIVHTVGEDKSQKNNSGHASPFMAYLMGGSLTVGALALPLSNFSSQPITPSLSCQLSISPSGQFCFKKHSEASEAAGMVNIAVHALAPPSPPFLAPLPPPPTLLTFDSHRPLVIGYTLGGLKKICTTSCQTPAYLSCLRRPCAQVYVHFW